MKGESRGTNDSKEKEKMEKEKAMRIRLGNRCRLSRQPTSLKDLMKGQSRTDDQSLHIKLRQHAGHQEWWG